MSKARWLKPLTYCLPIYILGGFCAPVLFPYKEFLSDPLGERVRLMASAAVRIGSYTGFFAIMSYVYFAIFYAALVRLNCARWAMAAIFFTLGVYFNLMSSGNGSGRSHAAIEQWLAHHGFPAIAASPWSTLIPLVLVFLVPLALVWIVARFLRAPEQVPA